MASPTNPVERLKATCDWGGLAVQGWVYSHMPWDAQILDVGAGWGKYRDLLPDYENVDAVEVHLPNIEAERLHERYRVCTWGNIVTLSVGTDFLHPYDLVIFGDVLEHLSADDARAVVAGVTGEAVFVVPFLYPQDAVDGNQHEAHLQDDLTLDVMADRYPQLRLEGIEIRDGKPFKGFYVKEAAWEPSRSAGSD